MAEYGTAVGYFASQNDAEIAINDLIQAGFKHSEIGLAARQTVITTRQRAQSRRMLKTFSSTAKCCACKRIG